MVVVSEERAWTAGLVGDFTVGSGAVAELFCAWPVALKSDNTPAIKVVVIDARLANRLGGGLQAGRTGARLRQCITTTGEP